jgi:pimeloyl-ACP methyl ester carboxylesterase
MPAHSADEEPLLIRVHGDRSNPCLVYLPGIHGDWTLIASFRSLISAHFYFVEFTYPRTLAWTLPDYAQAVLSALNENGITQCWFLPESFGSQVGWAIIQDLLDHPTPALRINGLILAGGFVKYPSTLLVRMVETAMRLIPAPLWKLVFWLYAKYSRFRHRHAPESAQSIHEFVARRTPRDIAAIRHRLRLIAANDPRNIARAIAFPLYLLAGAFDPVVPLWPVLNWTRKNCSSFQKHKVIWPADHNVLSTEPAKSSNQIVQWINPRGEGGNPKKQ